MPNRQSNCYENISSSSPYSFGSCSLADLKK
jgi:hypothetical protein